MQRRTGPPLTPAVDLRPLARRANEAHNRAVGAVQSALGYAIQAGEALAAARDQLDHGAWLPWLAANFHGGARTGQRYVRLYEHRGELTSANATRETHLPIRQALALLADPREADGLPAFADGQAGVADLPDGRRVYVLPSSAEPAPEFASETLVHVAILDPNAATAPWGTKRPILPADVALWCKAQDLGERISWRVLDPLPFSFWLYPDGKPRADNAGLAGDLYAEARP